MTLSRSTRIAGVGSWRSEGFAGFGPVFDFRETVADCLDLVTERTGAKEGAIGPANEVTHAVRMGQPEGRGQVPERHRRQLSSQLGP